jgi:hypothetical protein
MSGASVLKPAVPARNAVARRPFYIGISLVMGLIAVVGFWPTYFGPLVRGALTQPLLIHLHAIVFTGWLVLFLTQAVLAATGRVRWHLALGRVGIWYGSLLIVVGLTTGVLRSAAKPVASEGEQLLLAATADMIVFAPFFAAAIVFRRRPQIHKRLMVVAATMLLIAAASRMWFLPPFPDGIPIIVSIWLAPLAMAIAHDVWSRRRVHPVYLIGLVAFALRILAVFAAGTPAWSAIAQWIFALAGAGVGS